MRELKHQMQPTEDTCVSTCIAMVLGVPAAEVIADFHAGYMEGRLKPSAYLRARGARVRVCSAEETTAYPFIYMFIVPALGWHGENHAVVMDNRGGRNLVLDPTMGHLDRQFYVSRDSRTLPFCTRISGFVPMCEIQELP